MNPLIGQKHCSCCSRVLQDEPEYSVIKIQHRRKRTNVISSDKTVIVCQNCGTGYLRHCERRYSWSQFESEFHMATYDPKTGEPIKTVTKKLKYDHRTITHYRPNEYTIKQPIQIIE